MKISLRFAILLMALFVSHPVFAIEPELQAYLNGCPSANDPRFVAAADHFIARGKASGWWQEMGAVYFFCAPTQEAALVNVRDHGLNLTAEGGITFQPLTGIAGDGSTCSLNMKAPYGQIPHFDLNAHSLFVFCQTDIPSLSSEVGAGGGPNVGLRVRNAVNASIWSANRTQIFFKVRSARGLTGFVRTSADGGFWVKNNEQSDFSQKAVGLPTGNVQFFRVASYFSPNQLAFGFFGSGAITKAQTADLNKACGEMLGRLGTLADDKVEKIGPPNAFSRDSINQVTPKGLAVFRLAPVPPSNDINFTEKYAFGPVSDVICRPWSDAAKSTDTQVGRWEIIWSDRGLGLTPEVHNVNTGKANDTMGVITNEKKQQCRTEFSDYRKAVGSTLVKTAYSAGLQFRNDPDFPGHKGWGDIAEEWGYDVSPWQTRWEKNSHDPIFTQDLDVDTGEIVHRAFCADPKHRDAFFSRDAVGGVYKTAMDHVILGPGRLADLPMARGFMIDHEHADGRPPELEVQYIREMAEIAHSKKLLLGASGHSVTGGTGHAAGWRLENANELLNLFDWYTVIANSATPKGGQLADLEGQYNFFKGPGGKLPVPTNKLCLQMQIGGPGQEVSLADVKILRDFMISKGIMKCLPSNVYSTPGGSLSRKYNQVLATFLGLPTVKAP